MQESKQMARWTWLWPLLLLTACHRAAPVPDLLGETVADVWHRTALERPPVSDAPDPVPRSAVEQFQSATYEGPGKLQARVYALDSPAVALDLVQRWRPSADTVFFYRDRYFVVIKWQDADRKALEAFMADLEKRLGRPKE
jgi:hypothetical protein